jgi:hypothetical protein
VENAPGGEPQVTAEPKVEGRAEGEKVETQNEPTPGVAIPPAAPVGAGVEDRPGEGLITPPAAGPLPQLGAGLPTPPRERPKISSCPPGRETFGPEDGGRADNEAEPAGAVASKTALPLPLGAGLPTPPQGRQEVSSCPPRWETFGPEDGGVRRPTPSSGPEDGGVGRPAPSSGVTPG